jgi:hypothetical protein
LLQMQTIIQYLVGHNKKTGRHPPGSTRFSLMRTILV